MEGKEADYELVANADSLRLYIADHGRPMDVTKASARVTLLNGADKQEATLTPAGDRLEAKGTFKIAPGSRAVAVVTKDGRTFGTARFTLK